MQSVHRPAFTMGRYVIPLQLLLGFVIRMGLISSQYREVIADRVEISTLLNSWKRVTEGVSLYRFGISPYSGDIFHENPIALYFCDFMINSIPGCIGVVFVLTDLMTALVLYLTAKDYMEETERKQEMEMKTYAEGTEDLLLSDKDFKMSPVYVLAAYLFNPYSVLNCVGFTTTTFGNFCLALTFYCMIKRLRLPCCFFLALTVLQLFYPVVLLVPICIYIDGKKGKFSSVLTVVTFLSVLSLLLFVSYKISGDWAFMHSVYIVMLTVSDLRPNIGLFWYFFTEMFEHFRLLFIYSFQLNATLLYLAPLSFRFHSNPMLLATSLTALITVFKSYPCLGDVGFYMSLLPMWKHLFNSKLVVPDLQQMFVILCSLIITSILGPTVWHLWIYSRSANANFYFGVTLAFATAQIFLITDILFAYIKRDFILRNKNVSDVHKDKLKLSLE
ncbi:phosphatidylinositol glycan anchor biosynthesis class U protein [Cimex lectularius]|uniref:Phosphatidylinositol glycan anchor biosynthesis class U protein n=1 Tax=Cimex lectularius TaxID=79782 RepID=A0A8I6TGD6_CIMLE|nr:phosphatidylinositol glycan anchor biosynthesis class U protein [Cimex lectularius]